MHVRSGWKPILRRHASRRPGCAAFGHSRDNEFGLGGCLCREIRATGHADRVALKIVGKREISGWPARPAAGPLTDAPRRRDGDRRTLRHQVMVMLMDRIAISVVAVVWVDVPRRCKID